MKDQLQRPLVGEPRFAGSPWSEPRKAASPTHPLQRRCEPHPGPKRPDLSHKERYYKSKKIQTFSRRSRTPATLP